MMKIRQRTDREGFTLNLVEPNGLRAGSLRAALSTAIDDRQVMRVGSVVVFPDFRRRGLGTKLYERAARLACTKFGRPLASERPHARSQYSESFWRKQERKGRATCTGDSGSRARPCIEYVLACPAPRSLKEARR